jgi:hypothetical protein
MLNLKKDIVNAEVNIRSKVVTELLAINCTSDVSASLKEVFSLISSALERRLAKAHKSCTQWITLLDSSTTQFTSDWYSTQTTDINTIGTVAKIPRGLWFKSHVTQPSTITATTNQDYDEADYIQEWKTHRIQRATR